ncbi:hypothetical protein GcM1_148003 [Golovinomyces cichoracearum]|uniref:Uncharacterized protein n=1 Tax=Golovinomyces cichoracearum TaxID=62708 RepID=A0A420JB36_9PEZI|nr:hypothetical protein GcM1_148003 [Golovinomyces cichoracearum]
MERRLLTANYHTKIFPPKRQISGTLQNTFVVSALLGYNQPDSVHNDLQMRFKEEFNRWKTEDFAALDRDIRRVLRQCLSYCEVYFGHPNSKINYLLTDPTTVKSIPGWDKPVSIKSKIHKDTYAYARKQLVLAGNIILTPPATIEILATIAMASVKTVNNDDESLSAQLTQSQ